MSVLAQPARPPESEEVWESPGAAGQAPSSALAALAMRGACSRQGTQLWSCQLLAHGLCRWHCKMEKGCSNEKLKGGQWV